VRQERTTSRSVRLPSKTRLSREEFSNRIAAVSDRLSEVLSEGLTAIETLENAVSSLLKSPSVSRLERARLRHEEARLRSLRRWHAEGDIPLRELRWSRRVPSLRIIGELELAERVAKLGIKAALVTRPVRGSDFMSRQGVGRWAEDVVVSLVSAVTGGQVIAFGPSSAVVPGDRSYEEAILGFREISLVESKRPDLLIFRAALREMLEENATRIHEWPTRMLDDSDRALIAQASFAAEVKFSSWNYQKRLENKKESWLSLTLKEEERSPFAEWLKTFGRPLLLFQVFFDRVYCVNFNRMEELIALPAAITKGVYEKTTDTRRGVGKPYHKLVLTDETYLVGQVIPPAKPTARLVTLTDGQVVPMVDLGSARVAPAIDASKRIDREVARGSLLTNHDRPRKMSDMNTQAKRDR